MHMALLLSAAFAAKPNPEAALAAFYAGIDEMTLAVPGDAGGFDAFIMDEAGAPTRLSGPEGLARFEGLLAGWRSDGYTAVTRVSDARCVVSGKVAWCGAALSQDLLQHGERLDTYALRVTMALTWGQGRWRLAQLHESAGPA